MLPSTPSQTAQTPQTVQTVQTTNPPAPEPVKRKREKKTPGGLRIKTGEIFVSFK